MDGMARRDANDPANKDVVAEHGAPGRYIVVSQVKSNRVVYYTDDPDYEPEMAGDCYYVSIYDGTLPIGMTLRNCWGWRFNGRAFIEAREMPERSPEESLLESDRRALLRLLNEKIEAVRRPFAPACAYGDMARQVKLKEARLYLSRSREMFCSEDSIDSLKAVAAARNCSVWEAARLVVAKAEENERVVAESERFREQLSEAIKVAKDEGTLLELRRWLLDGVYPELSVRFAFSIDTTRPVDRQRILSEAHRLHEMSRLKAQLREAINRERRSAHSDYVGNDEVLRHKVMLAQSILDNGGRRRESIDYSVLETYAEARNLPLETACALLVDSFALNRERLMKTERVKDRVLARIDAIATTNDIDEIEELIAVM